MTDDLFALALAGFAAGLAIAMPLGAVAVLILRESVVHGVRTGLSAAAGVATVDLVYCAAAVAVGASIAPYIEPWLPVIAMISGLVIVIIGGFLLRSALRPPPADGVVPSGSRLAVYGRFVALTALNPATIVYFLALSAVLTTVSTSTLGPVVFVLAAALASLLWQAGLAVAGAAVGARVSERATRTLGIVAACVVMALGVIAIALAVSQS